MNTMKLQVIAAMMNFTLASLLSGTTSRINLKDRCFLTFKEAVRCEELILALFNQTQPDFENLRQSVYLAAVVLDNIQYVILGKYEEWEWFYALKWDYLMRVSPLVISVN